MSASRTYTLRQKTVTYTNTSFVPMPGVIVHIDGDGMIRGVSAEIAERILINPLWELIGGGSAAMAFQREAKAWRAARAAERNARETLRGAARAAYIGGTPLDQLVNEVADPDERDADAWAWMVQNDDGTLPEVTGEPEPPLPDRVAAPVQAVAPAVAPGLHNVQWDASLQAQSSESEAQRIARQFGASYIGEEPKRALVADAPEPSDPNGFGVTTEAGRGVPLPPLDPEPVADTPEAAPVADSAPALAPEGAPVDVGARLDAMSSRALADVARTLGADLPKRGVGEAAREFLAAQPAAAVIEALDARTDDKE